MIDIDKKDLETIKSILATHVPGCEVKIFGSRVTGHASRYSDIDLALVGRESIDRRLLEEIKDDFAESNLPFMVDVLDWHAISDAFRRIINSNFEVMDRSDLVQLL